MEEKVIEVIYEETEEVFIAKIKNLLAQICCGDEWEAISSFEEIVCELIERIKKKTDEQKAGMMGELLFQIVSYDIFEDYTHVSIYFNQEERSVKKGFDLLLFHEDTILYCEVKSKENGNEGDLTQLHIDKVKEAVADLKEKFRGDNTNLWFSAKLNMKNVKGINLKKQIADILTSDMEKAVLKDGVAVSVVFRKDKSHIDMEKINEYIEKQDKNFKSLKAVSITHNDYADIINVLERLNNGD